MNKLEFEGHETKFVIPHAGRPHGSWKVKENILNVFINPKKEENPDELEHTVVHELIEADINKLMARNGYPCHNEKSGESSANHFITYRTKKYESYGNLEIKNCLCHFLASASLFEFPKRKDWRKLVDFYLYSGFVPSTKYIKGEI